MKKKWLRKVFRRRMTVILMLLLQLIFFSILIIESTLMWEAIGWILAGVSVIVALGVVSKRVKPAFRLTWVFQILLFPIYGGLSYLMWELQKTGGREAKRVRAAEEHARQFLVPEAALPLERAIELAPDYERQVRYLTRNAGFGAYTDTAVEYLSSGEIKLKRLLEELEKAERYIFIEYFIIEEGVMWDSILEILRRKAESGVKVRVMYDDFGCFLRLPTDYTKTLESYGIEAVVFNPFVPMFTVRQNNRDHRKIVSIDGRVAFTGGINLADEYINLGDRYGHWKDAAVVMEGGAAWSMTLIFLELWSYATKTAEDFAVYRPEHKLCECGGRCDEGVVIPYSDSPTDNENVGEQVYVQIINTAKRYLYIDTPYLILDDTISDALCLAAKSGVDVRITTPSVPDKKIVHDTTRTYYAALLEAGVRIYEYSDGFIHAKTFVSDDITATVGTANLDFRSLYLHFECGVWMYGCRAVEDIRDDYLETIESCREILPSAKKRGIFSRARDEILRLLAPLM